MAARVALDSTSVWDERPSHVETHLIGASASDKPEALSTGQESIMKTGRTGRRHQYRGPKSLIRNGLAPSHAQSGIPSSFRT